VRINIILRAPEKNIEESRGFSFLSGVVYSCQV